MQIIYKYNEILMSYVDTYPFLARPDDIFTRKWSLIFGTLLSYAEENLMLRLLRHEEYVIPLPVKKGICSTMDFL